MLTCLTASDKKAYSACEQLWRTCFLDTAEFTRCYFTKRTRPEYVFADMENGEVRGMLHAIPRTVVCGKTRVPAVLTAGICVRPDYRNKGIATALMRYSEEVLAHKLGTAVVFLQPENSGLTPFYAKKGYSVFASHYRQEYLCNGKGISQAVTSDTRRVSEMYNALARKFTSYVERTESDFDFLISTSDFCVLTDYGYAIGDIKGDVAVCNETVLLNKDEAAKMANEVCRQTGIMRTIQETAEKLPGGTRCDFNMAKPLSGTPTVLQDVLTFETC